MVYALGMKLEEARIRAPQTLAVNSNTLLQVGPQKAGRPTNRRRVVTKTPPGLSRASCVILGFSNIIFIEFLGGI